MVLSEMGDRARWKFFSFYAAFAGVFAILMFDEVSLYCIDVIEHEDRPVKQEGLL